MSDLLMFGFVTSFYSLVIACCVTHLYALFNIQQKVQECDATKA